VLGFAGTNSIAPLRLDTSEPQALPEGIFRTVDSAEGGYSLLQMQSRTDASEWLSLYTWRTDEAAPEPDLELSNFWSCTKTPVRSMTAMSCAASFCFQCGLVMCDDAPPPPPSPPIYPNSFWQGARFTGQFFASRTIGEDRHHILNDSYVVRRADGTVMATTPIADKAQLVGLLEGTFGLTLPPDIQGVDRYLPGSSM
jgi:arylamine N-acetyltransferase